jgi:hypothetical protein
MPSPPHDMGFDSVPFPHPKTKFRTRRRLARDEMPDDDQTSRGGVRGALEVLAKKLSAEDWAEFQRVLNGDDQEAMDDLPDDAEGAPQNATGSLPDGKRAPAMDSARQRGFRERFPEATPTIHHTMGSQPHAPAGKTDVAGFLNRFPEAKRLR